MLITGLDHVQVAAPHGSEAATRHFYGEILGLPEIPKPETLAGRGGVWFQIGPQQLHVGIEDPFVPARKAHPAFLVTDLAALRQRIERAGLTVDEDAPLPGSSRFYCADPFGNRLEFLQPLLPRD
jgi:catechol 2,3-dioxygenase-like lactoylglutathione lyase family enzyme